MRNNSHLLSIFLALLEVSPAQRGSSCWGFTHFQSVVAGPKSSQRFVCSIGTWTLRFWNGIDGTLKAPLFLGSLSSMEASAEPDFLRGVPGFQSHVSQDGKSDRKEMYCLLSSNLRIHVARHNASPYSKERSL